MEGLRPSNTPAWAGARTTVGVAVAAVAVVVVVVAMLGEPDEPDRPLFGEHERTQRRLDLVVI